MLQGEPDQPTPHTPTIKSPKGQHQTAHSFHTYEGYFSEKELINVEDILTIFVNQNFKSFLEICSHVQEFIFKSKYNLKRNSMSNGKTITFVCSCISKKESKQSEDSFDEETKTCSNPRSKSSNRKIKRRNFDACRFRLKFKRDKKTQLFSLHKSSNFVHNHPPHENISVEEFRNLSRNIKFPLKTVILIIMEIVKEASSQKTVKVKYIKEIRNKIMTQHFDHVDEKTLRGRYSKKLYYFIDVIRHLVLKHGEKKKCVIYREVFGHILSKNAATYLRQDCLEILFEAVNK